MMDDAATECPEVIGKVVKSLKISQGRLEGTEVHLDFADGTTLSVSVTPVQKTEASLLICGGPGEPELLRKYDLD
jgi:hypothetical protein